MGEELRHQIEKGVINFLDVLRIVSPGTSLRAAIDDVVRAGMGALILVEADGIEDVIDGGFKVDCNFTQQRLIELCKMDGGIVLSGDLKRILYSNVLVVPDHTLPTQETGTRHKAAERIAKQLKTLVIAISERRKKVTLYYNQSRYELTNTEDILRRTNETLRILEKQRELYDELITNLNVSEITGLVALSDVCSVLQRIQIILKMEDLLKKAVVELGQEGIIVRMRLREIMGDIDKTKHLILKDYTGNSIEIIEEKLDELDFHNLLDTTTFAKLLFDSSPESSITPQGYRIIGKTSLTEQEINSLIKHFDNLNSLLESDETDLIKIIGHKAVSFTQDLKKLKEQIMMGKKV
ncbi:DNA integrity scanning protein DisA [Candidatus Pacearchaeota archaeon]|nr:DNA integrity scanning protein DisA [Candidatus Pacearchaeota archaeon]